MIVLHQPLGALPFRHFLLSTGAISQPALSQCWWTQQMPICDCPPLQAGLRYSEAPCCFSLRCTFSWCPELCLPVLGHQDMLLRKSKVQAQFSTAWKNHGLGEWLFPSQPTANPSRMAPRPALYSIESGALESHCLSFASMIGLHIPHGGVAGEAPLCVAEHTLVPQDTSETMRDVASTHMEPTLMILRRPDEHTRDLQEIN